MTRTYSTALSSHILPIQLIVIVTDHSENIINLCTTSQKLSHLTPAGSTLGPDNNILRCPTCILSALTIFEPVIFITFVIKTRALLIRHYKNWRMLCNVHLTLHNINIGWVPPSGNYCYNFE